LEHPLATAFSITALVAASPKTDKQKMHELANRRNTLLLLIEDGDEQKKVELAEVDAKIQQLIKPVSKLALLHV